MRLAFSIMALIFLCCLFLVLFGLVIPPDMNKAILVGLLYIGAMVTILFANTMK